MLLVTGANGQLGSELRKLLPSAIFTDIEELDITNPASINDFVKENKIDTIINCAAYTAVDKAEDDAELCHKVNALAPKYLAQTGAKLIHISTDYVFDGKNHKPYKPKDIAIPASVYGKTKLEGEIEVMECAQTAIIIRTAWVYSSFGSNFVKTMRKLGSERDALNVVADQIGSPTYAFDLASAIVQILPQIKDEQKAVYHYTNEGVCSWYDFAIEIMQQSNITCEISPIPSERYPTKATRPFYSVLDKSSLKEEFNIVIPHWKESLKQCLNQF